MGRARRPRQIQSYELASKQEMEDYCPAFLYHLPYVESQPRSPEAVADILYRPLASSMFAPGVPVIMADLHNTSNTFATFVVSIFVLGFAAGPLVLAPLSELYGRVPVYHVCNVAFLCFTVMCAISKDSGMLLASRFWAGFAGVATVTCGSSTIADMVARENRATAMSFWAMGPLLGPVIGPVVGGVLVEKANWRWTFWTITIMASAGNHGHWVIANQSTGRTGRSGGRVHLRRDLRSRNTGEEGSEAAEANSEQEISFQVSNEDLGQRAVSAELSPTGQVAVLFTRSFPY